MPARVNRAHGVDNIVKAPRAENRVDLGQFFRELLTVALGQTSRRDDGLELARFFQLHKLQDLGNGLRLGRFDKAAGVDDPYVGLFRVLDLHHARGGEVEEHAFAVNLVFGAAKGDQVDFDRVRAVICHVIHPQFRFPYFRGSGAAPPISHPTHNRAAREHLSRA